MEAAARSGARGTIPVTMRQVTSCVQGTVAVAPVSFEQTPQVAGQRFLQDQRKQPLHGLCDHTVFF